MNSSESILKLVEEKRGIQKGFEYIAPGRVLFTYEMPLNEIVLDFYDRLKSISRGYASFDYHLSGYRTADLVKLDILVSGEPVDALSWIVHRDSAYARGKALVEKMRELIPAADVRGRDSGGHRQPRHRAGNHRCHSQERHCEVLRRRHLAQTQTAGKAEGRQEAHEARRESRHPSGSISRSSEGRIVRIWHRPIPALRMRIENWELSIGQI